MSTRKAVLMTAAALASFCTAWIAITTYRAMWRPTQENDIREAIVCFEVEPPLARHKTLFRINAGTSNPPPYIQELEARLAGHPRKMQPTQRLQEGERGISIMIGEMEWRRNDEVWVSGSCWPINPTAIIGGCGNGTHRTWIVQRQPNGQWIASCHPNVFTLIQPQTPWLDRVRLYREPLLKNLGF